MERTGRSGAPGEMEGRMLVSGFLVVVAAAFAAALAITWAAA
jgi:hypothetical protein